ncbi:MAG: translocation/assembly module TamB domain-containing protein [Acidobacteriales bacterium]|nr:translocation/assembly module TamB domain-containing protein [Terriglobales bacterium]
MTETANPKPRRRWKRWIFPLFLLVATALVWYLNSGRFRDNLRARLVSELERTSGARVELKQFDWSWRELGFTADGLTLHGLEPAGAPPLAQVDHLAVRLQVLSYLTGDVWLRTLEVRKPEIHIVISPDGHSNIPAPKTAPSDQGYAKLFEVTIERLNVEGGSFRLNAESWPLDFQADELKAAITYSIENHRYDGTVAMGRSLAAIGKQLPLSTTAEAHFRLYPTRAELTEFRVTSAGSHLEGSARIDDLRQVHGSVRFTGSIALEEFGRVVREPALRAGVAAVSGTSRFTGAGFTSEGKVALRDGSWQSPHLRVSGVSAAARFVASEKAMEFDRIVAQLLGGTARGGLTLAGWAEEKYSPRRVGQGRFTVAGVEVAKALQSVSSPLLPLSSLRATGAAGGNVSVDWTGAHTNAVISFAGDVVPPQESAPGEVPVRAKAAGRFDGLHGILTFDSLDLSTPATTIRAEGTWGTDKAEMKVNIATTDLSELEPPIALFGGPSRMPVSIAGRAGFEGTVSGPLLSPRVRGHLRANDFASQMWLPSRPQPAPRRIHWDSLEAGVDASASRLVLREVRLQHGGSTIELQADAGLRRWRLTDDSPVRLQTKIRNASLREVQQLAGLDYPFTGQMQLSLELGGTMAAMHGEGDLQVSNGTLWGEPFDGFRSPIRFSGSSGELGHFTVSKGSNTITGSVSFDHRVRTIQFDLSGHKLALADFQRLQFPRITLTGTAELTAGGQGPLDAPNVQAKLQVSDLTVNGEQEGGLEATAQSRGRRLELDVVGRLRDSRLLAKGTVEMAGALPANLHFEMDRVDLDPLLDLYLSGRLTGHSSFSGTVDLDGPLRRPRELALAGRLDQVAVSIENITLNTDRPVVFRVEHQRFLLSDFHIQGEGTDLGVSGNVEMTGDRRLDLRANGRANLKLFQGLNRELISSGDLAVEMTVGGAWDKPTMAGTVSIHNAGVSLIDLPNGLSNIEGTMAFNQNRLEVQRLTARTGGGTLDLGGTISFRNGLFFDLTASGRDIRLRYPTGMSSSANADLRYVGTLKTGLISGDAVVTRIGISPRFDLATVLANMKQAQTRTTINPVLEGYRLDIHLISAADLRFETALVRVAGDADLRIRGSLARPNVLGRVTMAEGDLSFAGTKYRLERGEISFTNPVRIEPTLNLEAVARVREYDITIAFRGPAEKLTATYRSEPPLPTADIIALLAFGRTRQDSTVSSTTQAYNESTTNALLGEAIDAAISSRVQKIFGVSRIKIDPSVGGATNNPNARVTIEQQVTNNVTLIYTTDVTRSAQQVIQAEINVTRDVSLLMVRDQNGVFSVDIRLRRRKK